MVAQPVTPDGQPVCPEGGEALGGHRSKRCFREECFSAALGAKEGPKAEGEARRTAVVVADLREQRGRGATEAAVGVEEQVKALNRVALFEEATHAFDEVRPTGHVLFLLDDACAVGEARERRVATHVRLERRERARVQLRLQVVRPKLDAPLEAED